MESLRIELHAAVVTFLTNRTLHLFSPSIGGIFLHKRYCCVKDTLIFLLVNRKALIKQLVVFCCIDRWSICFLWLSCRWARTIWVVGNTRLFLLERYCAEPNCWDRSIAFHLKIVLFPECNLRRYKGRRGELMITLIVLVLVSVAQYFFHLMISPLALPSFFVIVNKKYNQ